MIGLLLKIKHRMPVLWRGIEHVNALLFVLLHGREVMANARACLDRYRLEGVAFRLLTPADSADVSAFLARQPSERTAYFKPHGFDLGSVSRQAKTPTFVMFGAFRGDELVGYFFLRCFWNRRAFVGRIIDPAHEGKGIGRVMNSILYNTAWDSGFQCMTTISRHNHAVVRSHANNPSSHVLGDLPDDYMLVEMVRPDGQATGVPVRDRIGSD